MKIGIVMTYYKRNYQLANTLLSMGLSEHEDFFAVIVDDCSGDTISIPETRFPVTLLHVENKYWKNNDVAGNIGIYEALRHNPGAIILQNAECRHEGDIISYVSSNITDKNYIPFCCFSLNEYYTFNKGYDLYQVISQNNKTVLCDGDLGWYNHPVYRNVGYEFCAAISIKNMIVLNGYDERFMHGWGYGDNYLKHRVKLLGLNFETPESPFVVHQWHYSASHASGSMDKYISDNRALFIAASAENKIKAEHIITPNFKA